MALKQAFSTTDGITDLLYVATNLNVCCDGIPDDFIISDPAEKPIEVFSPEAVFGANSNYEFKNYFEKYYDQTTEQWTDIDMVAAEIKSAVLLQQTDYNTYLQQLKDWNLDYASQRSMEYRKYLAQRLIDVCV